MSIKELCELVVDDDDRGVQMDVVVGATEPVVGSRHGA